MLKEAKASLDGYQRDVQQAIRNRDDLAVVVDEKVGVFKDVVDRCSYYYYYIIVVILIVTEVRRISTI